MAIPLPRPIPADLPTLRRFAKVRLVIADLDGTVMPSGSHETRTVSSLVGQLSGLGIKLAIATGRSYLGAMKIMDALQLPGTCPLIAYNGGLALLRVTDRPVLHNVLPIECLKETLQFAAETDDARILAYFYHTSESLQAPTNMKGQDSEFVVGWGEPAGTFKDFNGLPIEWNPSSLPDYGPTSVLLENVAPESVETLRRRLHAWRIRVESIGSTYLELRPPNTDKMQAGKAVARRLKLPPHSVMVIGDNDNDIPLLEWAGIGVVVASASEGAKTAAQFITTGGPEHGFIEALDLLKRARRYGGL